MKLETIAGPMISLALTEDLGSGDITTEAIVPEDAAVKGSILARAGGVIAGVDVVKLTFATADPAIVFERKTKDGEAVKPDQEICRISGPARGILVAERTALNFLQRLSGIASMTRTFVDAVSGTNTTILDTRKTTPGLRILEKYAVSVGGGGNHRFGLFDMFLIKDNHLKISPGIDHAVKQARAANADIAVEVEVTTIDELKEACASGADRVMLDNMTLDQVRESCDIVKNFPVGQRPKVEVSGGVTLETVREYALCGVDYISVGGLTHSAPALDMSLELEV
jgi:nicotinate-nucleotide pyrophosphorylase (carboxylating)